MINPTNTTSIFVPEVAPFAYSALPAAVAEDLRRGAASIRTRITKTTADIIETGRELAEAKERLDHGQFAAWVQSEVGIAVRTAQAYMAIARLADAKGATVALLPPTTVHRLAQKSAPAVVSQVEAGKIVPDTAVVEMLAAAKFQQRQAGRSDQQAVQAKRRKRHHREAERRGAEDEARRDRELQAARDAALRLMGGLGAAGVAILLGELNRAVNELVVIDELRKAVDRAADNQHSGARGSS